MAALMRTHMLEYEERGPLWWPQCTYEDTYIVEHEDTVRILLYVSSYSYTEQLLSMKV